MAEKRFNVHLDLNGNWLMNTGFEQRATPPTALFAGQEYWDTTTNSGKVYDGTQWISGNQQTTLTSATPSLTLPLTGANYELSIANADGTNPGLLSNGLYDLISAATPTNNFGTLVQRDAAGVFSTNTVAGLQPPTADAEAANKKYVDDLVAGAITTSNTYTDTSATSGMRIKGNLDCTTNPPYPAALQGDTYVVSFEGFIGGAAGVYVRANDMAICISDTASGNQAIVGASWFIQEKNLDFATDTVGGYVRLATPAEVAAGATDAGASSPAIPTIDDVNTSVASGGIKTFVQKLSAGTTSYNITHNLNGAVMVQVYNKANGSTVEVDSDRTSVNTTTISVSAPLANDHVCVLIRVGDEPA